MVLLVLAHLHLLELGADVAILEVLELVHRLGEAALLLGDHVDFQLAGAVGEVVLRRLDLTQQLASLCQIRILSARWSSVLVGLLESVLLANR